VFPHSVAYTNQINIHFPKAEATAKCIWYLLVSSSLKQFLFVVSHPGLGRLACERWVVVVVVVGWQRVLKARVVRRGLFEQTLTAAPSKRVVSVVVRE